MWTKFSHYALAVSGGADSVFLFYQALQELPNKNFEVLHVNHGTRDESQEEARYVQALCDQYQIKCTILDAQNLSLTMPNFEFQAREQRYQLMEEHCQRYDIKCLVTAHHRDDVCETVFINLLRGSTRIFIPKERQNKDLTIYRPLLTYSKKEILDYLSINNYLYCEDSSNQNNHYLRNFIRNQIFPFFDKKIQHWRSKLLKAVQIQQDDHDFLHCHTREWIQQYFSDLSMKKQDFLDLHPAIQHRVLFYKLNELSPQKITGEHVEDLIYKIKHSKKGRFLIFDYSWAKFYQDQEQLVFILEKQKKNLEKNIRIVHNNNVYFDCKLFSVQLMQGRGLRITIDDEVELVIVEHDWKIAWNKGHSSVKKILKDKKVPIDSESYVILKNQCCVGILNPSFSFIISTERADVSEQGIYFDYYN